jgi:hypothetical protein
MGDNRWCPRLIERAASQGPGYKPKSYDASFAGFGFGRQSVAGVSAHQGVPSQGTWQLANPVKTPFTLVRK